MDACPADPARTQAILVGVERYEAGSNWNLNGPVRDVLAFHTWLRGAGVPSGQIQMLVSPMDENLPLLAAAQVDGAPATSQSVRAALNALHGRKGDLLFIFWAGHGVVNEQQHRLFMADATINDKRNLALETLCQSLGSSYFAGFPRQIIVIDACANYQSFGFTFPSDELPSGDPLPHEQFIFLAARPGQVAKNLGQESRGLFSRELLRQLQNPGAPNATWPPDMRRLAERVQEVFAGLRAAGQAAQSPIYEWSRDWDGNKIELVPSPTGARASASAAQTWQLTFPQLAGLTDALVTCGKMSLSQGRDDLLSQIRFDISGAVSRRSDTKSDVMNIVRTACDFPGGLEELLRHVKYYEGQSAGWRRVETFVAERLPHVRVESEESSEALQ